jgi:hypothetical protein
MAEQNRILQTFKNVLLTNYTFINWNWSQTFEQDE